MEFGNEDVYGFPDARIFARLSIEEMRKCGLSRKKSEYIKNFSMEVENGFNVEGLKNRSEDEIIDILTSFRGIGKWTAHLVMVASMGRNVVPAEDLGVRKAISHFYFNDVLQDEERIREFSENKFGRFARDCLVYLLMAYRMGL